MNFRKLVATTRSVRRFDETRLVTMSVLEALVDLARQTASAGNSQPLAYVLVNDPDANAELFATLGWAAYLTDWPGPQLGEQPTAYLVMCVNRELGKHAQVDAGIQAQTIMLGARDLGFAACMLGSINRKQLAPIVALPESHDILYVIALGAPGEKVVQEQVAQDGNIKYWRDADGCHHVPKRPLDQVILGRLGK